ncbi:ABC transporter substrate-binding protein [Mesorhizobium xinjiangense]|uniref:ABC transporter substrate-binding protein n=1 Tax=Mesorhizobium xinjiangense TaxID=2678685 RepID=UPI0012EED9E8|nr:ABC transporter substrate-binding protein [Mesorhizobium xinjiangense]
MPIMKRLALAASAAAIAASFSAANAQETLKIGTEGAYPPFNNLTADGKLVGFDVEIAEALCEEMKVECEFVTQDWDGIIPALQAGKFDAIVASMSITPERMEQVNFTDPYYVNSLVFIAPKDSDMDPSAVGNMVIGVQEGTIAAIFAEETYPDADLKAYPTQLEAWSDLDTGRVDAVLADFGVQYDWINSDDGACCEFKGDPVSSDDRIGIALRKDETELRDRFNTAIKAIRENGTYAEINKKYFPFDIYGE